MESFSTWHAWDKDSSRIKNKSEQNDALFLSVIFIFTHKCNM